MISTDDVKDLDGTVSFNSDSSTCVYNNSTNAQIWNNEANFVLGSMIQLEKTGHVRRRNNRGVGGS